MTERTLREQIAGTLASFFHDHHGQLLAAADAIIQEFCTLDAHTAQPAVDVSEPHVDEHQRGLSVADERQKPAPDAVAEAAKVLLEALHSDQVQGAVDTMHGMLPVGTARGDAQIGATFFLDALAKGQQP